MRYSFRKGITIALAVSAIGHGVAIYPETVSGPAKAFGRYASDLMDRYDKYRIKKERAELLGRARKGEISLGHFLIQGNSLDARERGEEKDAAKAQKRYDAYLGAISSSIGAGKQPYESVPEALSGMNYYGVPGGEVLDALNDNGGSCAQLAPLLAALLYDSNYTAQSFVRTYGANSEGLSHDTAVYRDDKGVEYDLQKGAYSDGRGTLIPARWLVEAYAKAHGLPYEELRIEREPGTGGDASCQDGANARRKGPSSPLPPGKPTGLDLPRGEDEFEGSAPIFSRNAVPKFDASRGRYGGRNADPDAQASGSGHPEVRPPSGDALVFSPARLKERGLALSEFLNVQNVARLPSSSNPVLVRVHPVTAPDEATLERLGSLIEAAKSAIRRGENGVLVSPAGVERLSDISTIGDFETFLFIGAPASGRGGESAWKTAIALGVMMGLYHEAEWNFRLAGKHDLANAVQKAKEGIAVEAGPALDALGRDMKDLPAPSTDPWVLAYLGTRGGEALARYVDACPAEKKPLRSAAVLLAMEQTRAKALEIVSGFRLGDQTEVFKMMQGAEAEGKEETLRAYSVFNFVNERFGELSEKRHSVMVTLGEKESTMIDGVRIRAESIGPSEKAGIPGSSERVFIALIESEGSLRRDIFRVGDTKTIAFGYGGGGRRDVTIKLVQIDEAGGAKARFDVDAQPKGNDGINPASPQGPKISVAGRLNIHEALTLSGFTVTLEGFASQQGTRKAILALRTKNNNETKTLAGEGEIAEFPHPGPDERIDAGGPRKLLVRVRNMTDTGAVVEVLASDPREAAPGAPSHKESFKALKDMVAGKCSEQGLGEDWQTALITACADWAMEKKAGRLEGRFGADLAEWAQGDMDAHIRLHTSFARGQEEPGQASGRGPSNEGGDQGRERRIVRR